MKRQSQTLFLGLILSQAAHSIEEYYFRLYDVLPPARFVSSLVSSNLARGFAIVNIFLVSFGLGCYLSRVRGRHPSGRMWAWFWAVFEAANGAGHLVLAADRGGYFPGVATAPLLLGFSVSLGVTLLQPLQPFPAASFATIDERDSAPTLYARLLGPSWLQIAEQIRFAHTTHSTVHAHGRLRIAHGRNHLARLLARLLRLPRESEAAETRLVVTPCADGEQWLRTFDDRRLDTRQYQSGECELAERIGVLEFRFRLEPSEQSLLFRQVDAALLFGSNRLRLPRMLTPRVDAREDPAGAHRISVLVRIALPVVGTVLAYDGTIDIEDTPP